LQEQISKIFVDNVSGVTDLIEAKFSQMEKNNKIYYDGIIKAITVEKNNKIVELETEIKRLTMLEGELKGKDDTIERLDLRIN
jgi:hypothetical protein